MARDLPTLATAFGLAACDIVPPASKTATAANSVYLAAIQATEALRYRIHERHVEQPRFVARLGSGPDQPATR
jgi:hypothetical protein